ncbi:uracil-DNA glycosylase [Primorskyibacter aestuariivivens]|uniref:uracil-DNA glycosylase n=1 Tax=Primorskyibacter aestuariivivens TaxID=1888912 RepID=UPI002300223D|nr:uracil-DNA glycosylase [Primorskyibacter aestuariivivens]MDA7429992.1 uracil-DNA glycosylase [Primorskyibacter aestuariivivens]
MEYHEHIALRAALEWQIEAGVIDALGEEPVDRYAVQLEARAAPKPEARVKAPAAPVEMPKVDPVVVAQQSAAQAGDLAALEQALSAFEHCELKMGARNLVFSDGSPDARVMIIGEAPGRDEDRQGKPFVGRAGQLLDKMLAAIGLNRAESVYITNVLPWRPPQNRDPKPDEIAMMRPFVQRHVELVAPELVVLMGNISCDAGLGRRGITRLRGHWTEAYGKPALPMFHPAYLLRQPQMKREAWADLLEIRARLG